MNIVIIGAGKMGKWLSDTLSENNNVGTFDIDPSRTRELRRVWTFSSLTEVEKFRPEILINAVNLGNTSKVFNQVSSYISEECILADIASIKGELPIYYRNSGHKFVSTHPMFGPTYANMTRPAGESAIIIRESDENGKKFFRDFYQQLGLKTFEFSFVEHDSMMAYSLTLPFSSSMAFAACVDSKTVPGTNFRKHMELARGLLSEDDSLLSEILFNPKSISQLEKITSRLELLKHIIRDHDYEEAAKFYDRLRQNIDL